ncbi:MAG TPA: LPS export ABC transporter permease LptG [Parvularculaceae bacterium]|nr:LPS export ABC transporter permease LptG [Parvularculaceae bacterium]
MTAVDGIFGRYVGLRFLVRFVGILALFVVVIQMLNLLGNSRDILAAKGAGWDSIFRYVWLHLPKVVTEFIPFAALLAVVITLSTLNLSNEITVMRAAGMSAHRVLFPIGCACAGIALFHFVFNEAVAVGAARKLAYWQANDYATDLPPDSVTRTNVRVAHNDEYIHAGSAARIDGGVWLNNLTISRLTPGGLIEGETEARGARYQDGKWRLFDVRSFDVSTLAMRRAASADWPEGVDPELIFALSFDPNQTSLPELWRKIVQLREDGADARAATTSFLSRFSKPIATLAMPLLGAIAGFGVSRQGNQLLRAVIGGALGFSYFIAENMMIAVGELGVAPAMLGAFFPFALFTVVGFSILLAMES